MSKHNIILFLFCAVLGIEAVAQDVYVANPFVQPNDSTLNWYGSGDANGDDTLTWDDVTRMQDLIDGTFTDPDDSRLYDRADVNGDQVIDALDRSMLEEHLNTEPLFQPHWYWNKLKTRAEREEWLLKMMAIDKTNEAEWEGQIPDWDCNQYSWQTMINFTDITDTILNRIYYWNPTEYNLNNRGRFKLYSVGFQ